VQGALSSRSAFNVFPDAVSTPERGAAEGGRFGRSDNSIRCGHIFALIVSYCAGSVGAPLFADLPQSPVAQLATRVRGIVAAELSTAPRNMNGPDAFRRQGELWMPVFCECDRSIAGLCVVSLTVEGQ
jgi:hypothetical protein